MRLKGAEVVNTALDSRIDRESSWSRKHSTICESDTVFRENIENDNFLTIKLIEKSISLILFITALYNTQNSTLAWHCIKVSKVVQHVSFITLGL